MGSGGLIIIWILVFFGIFYFLAIKPQRRQRQAHAEMVQMLKKGDEVVTIGGMLGIVTRIDDDRVEIEIAKRTRVWFLKRAISSITAADEEDEDEYVEAEADEDDEPAQLTEGDDAADQAEEPAVAEEDVPEEPAAPEPPKV
jgi:preprotein translocase subunit YajC